MNKVTKLAIAICEGLDFHIVAKKVATYNYEES